MPSGFDGAALFAALDAQRAERALSWTGVGREIWQLSADLNARRNDHPIVASTLTGLGRRHDTSCQHALFMLRWLGASPESFLDGPSAVAITPLPAAGPDQRLRWKLHATERRPTPGLYEALDARRRAEHVTWPELGELLRCTPNRLSGMRSARFAVAMSIAMRVTQWLGQPAADFVEVSGW